MGQSTCVILCGTADTNRALHIETERKERETVPWGGYLHKFASRSFFSFPFGDPQVVLGLAVGTFTAVGLCQCVVSGRAAGAGRVAVPPALRTFNGWRADSARTPSPWWSGRLGLWRCTADAYRQLTSSSVWATERKAKVGWWEKRYGWFYLCRFLKKCLTVGQRLCCFFMLQTKRLFMQPQSADLILGEPSTLEMYLQL